MTLFTLTQGEISKLKIVHRTTKNKRDADRIKAIIYLGTEWTIREVSEILFLSEETVRNYLKRFESGKLEALLKDNYKGYGGKLSRSDTERLDDHLKDNIYASTKEIVSYVSKHFGVEYSISGMNDLLHKLGYTYKSAPLGSNLIYRQMIICFFDDFITLDILDPQRTIFLHSFF